MSGYNLGFALGTAISPRTPIQRIGVIAAIIAVACAVVCITGRESFDRAWPYLSGEYRPYKASDHFGQAARWLLLVALFLWPLYPLLSRLAKMDPVRPLKRHDYQPGGFSYRSAENEQKNEL